MLVTSLIELDARSHTKIDLFSMQSVDGWAWRLVFESPSLLLTVTFSPGLD